MTRRYLFADEAGNFDFSRSRGASRFFILATVAMDDCAAGDEMLRLRRDLAWEGLELGGHFHAVEERQAVRDRVFALLRRHDFRIDATIIEKAKVPLAQRPDEARFYKTAWFLHLQHVAPQIAIADDELLIVASSVGTARRRSILAQAVADVVRDAMPEARARTAFWLASSDPCLQVADYCCWAIQRTWEGADPRSYVLIQDKIRTKFDALAASNDLYY